MGQYIDMFFINLVIFWNKMFKLIMKCPSLTSFREVGSNLTPLFLVFPGYPAMFCGNIHFHVCVD